MQPIGYTSPSIFPLGIVYLPAIHNTQKISTVRVRKSESPNIIYIYRKLHLKKNKPGSGPSLKLYTTNGPNPKPDTLLRCVGFRPGSRTLDVREISCDLLIWLPLMTSCFCLNLLYELHLNVISS